MIAPLKIGNKIYSNNLIQGPLAGYSTPAFRLLAWQHSKPAFSYSEMISANGLVNNPKQTIAHFLIKDPHEGPVAFQLFGKDIPEIAKATKMVSDLGADLIDFNCGCSVPKVRSNGSGSKLLSDLPKLSKILLALRQNTDLPLLVKIRVAKDEKTNSEIAKILNDSGVDGVVVHGRNWNDGFNGSCRLEAIGYFVQNLKAPVIGNGDVNSIESLKKMFATGCKGVMISRAGVGEPWLIGKLMAEMKGENFTVPTLSEIGKIYITHIENLSKLFNNERIAILHARKFARPYAKNIKRRKDFCLAINKCESFDGFQRLCMEYFK
jgi:tRNA-dihydrouridine synthase B